MDAAEFRPDPVLPHVLKGHPFNKRMNIGLDEILPDQYFMFQEIFDRQIRQIITEFLERLYRSEDVIPFRPDKNIRIESRPGIAVNGKGRGSDDDEDDLIFF